MTLTVEQIRKAAREAAAWIEATAEDILDRFGSVCPSDVVDAWEQQAKDATPGSVPPFLNRRQGFSDVQPALTAWAEREGLRSELRPSPKGKNMRRRYYLR